MAWCENPNCKKDGLRKADVEFDDERRMILCHGCYAMTHPGWVPPLGFIDVSPVEVMPVFDYEFSVSNQDGIAARFVYGDVKFAFTAPMGDIKRLLG